MPPRALQPATNATNASDASVPRPFAPGEPFGAFGRSAPYHRALVVANPVAGRGRGQAAGVELATALASLGIATDVHLTTCRGDAQAHVRACDGATDLVFAVGGDGTLAEVLEGVAGRPTTVGLLPLGTANMLAMQFGLPRDIPRVLEAVAGRRTAELDVARANGAICFLCAGVGIDGWVVREMERRRRGAISKWAYVRALASVLSNYSAPELELEVDGQVIDGRFGFVLIGNLRLYGAYFRLAADALPADGLFEVYAIPRADVPGLLALGMRGFFARLPGRRGRLLRGSNIAVRSAAQVAVQVDGDYRGETPLALRVESERRRILIP